jgi:hypothetical protein
VQQQHRVGSGQGEEPAVEVDGPARPRPPGRRLDGQPAGGRGGDRRDGAEGEPAHREEHEVGHSGVQQLDAGGEQEAGAQADVVHGPQ